MKIPAFEPIDLSNEDERIELELFKILPNPEQPRKIFNETALEELASSIREHGIIQPILVKKITSDKFYIIAGERRWRAAKMTGLTVLPVIVKGKIDDDKISYLSLVENLQRENLNPMEEAEAFNKLMEKFYLTHEQISEKLGKSRSEISNKIRLLNLQPEVKIMLRDSMLTYGHTKTLLSLDRNNQILLARNIIEKQLSVRETEKCAKAFKSDNKEKTFSKYEGRLNDWQKKLSSSLQLDVKIKIDNEGQGRVVIFFDSPDVLEWFINKLDNSR